jgi:hypothetical protein
MFLERARMSAADHADRAARDVETRRTALDEALAAIERGDPDADPIDVIDRALALQAAQAVAASVAAREPAL